jgi:hypothetical protein
MEQDVRKSGCVDRLMIEYSISPTDKVWWKRKMIWARLASIKVMEGYVINYK